MFAWYLLPLSHGLLAELCSVTADLSLWLTQAQTRAQSNLVRFVTLNCNIRGSSLHLPTGVSARTRRKDNKRRYLASCDVFVFSRVKQSEKVNYHLSPSRNVQRVISVLSIYKGMQVNKLHCDLATMTPRGRPWPQGMHTATSFPGLCFWWSRAGSRAVPSSEEQLPFLLHSQNFSSAMGSQGPLPSLAPPGSCSFFDTCCAISGKLLFLVLHHPSRARGLLWVWWKHLFFCTGTRLTSWNILKAFEPLMTL